MSNGAALWRPSLVVVVCHLLLLSRRRGCAASVSWSSRSAEMSTGSGGVAAPTAVGAEAGAAIRACLRYLTSPPSSSASLDVSAAFFDAVCEMMEGRATEAQLGGFLAALSSERFTPAILAACARSLRDHATPVPLPDGVGPTIDIVGTGGDGADSFNVSTAAALVVAACGQPVAKHGNRSSSSRCGSADLMEACGACLSLSPAAAAQCLQRCGFVFLFAQSFHPAMRFVAGARRSLGIRTVFNVLGPLSNPCIPAFQLTGVYSRQLGPLFALSLHRLGVRRALIVHGVEEGMDELSPHGPTAVWRLTEDGAVEELELTPLSFGLQPHSIDEVRSGSAADNAATLRAALRGEAAAAAVADWIVMNAGAALVCAGRAADWKAGADAARAAIQDGRALRLLDEYCAVSTAAAAQRKPSMLETIARHRQQQVEAAKAHLPLPALLHSALWKYQPPKLSNVLERLRKVTLTD